MSDNPTPESAGDSASPEKRFDVLYEQLKLFLKEFTDFEFKHGTVLVVILGAMFAGMGKQFEPTTGMKIGVTVFAGLFFGLHIYWVYLQRKASDSAYLLLEGAVKYIPPGDVEPLRIKRWLAVSFVLNYGAFLLAICLLLWFWPLPKIEPERQAPAARVPGYGYSKPQ
jgi:hypothetical protein